MLDKTKQCSRCHRILAAKFTGDICPACQEEELFGMVKDYIRSNVVNEYMVAEYFDIPLRKVRGWIREGRIEYREKEAHIVGTRCQRCGKSITFGSMCRDCMRLINLNDKQIHLAENPSDKKDDKMRFLE